MLTFCRFCRHGNPDGAKFCNECGSQLSLAPCPSCEAINDRDASTCHQCGAALAPLVGSETTSADRPVMAVAGDDCVEATGVLPASFLQNNGAVTDESIQPPVPDTPFEPAAHVPESFAESLAAKNSGDGMAEGSHRNAIDDTRSTATHAPSTPAGREAEDVDVGLREDLRAFRQSLGQQRRASRGDFAVIAIAVIAVGVGAYALYRSDAPLQRASKEVAANPTVQGKTASADAAAKAGDQDRGIATSTSSVGGADGVIAPNTAGNDSARQSATASPEDTKSTMADDVAPSSSSTSTPESRQATATGESPPSSPPAKTSKARSAKTTRTANARNAPNSRAPAVTSSTSAATVNRPSDADAIATERLIARDLGRFGPTAPPNRSAERVPQDTRDRDASATQRLVDRDLGAFRNGSSATRPDRAFPEIN